MAPGWAFVQGMGFGLAVAAPVGPMAMLCMRRTLADGWRPGLATGAGIATGDGIYATVAVAGLTGLAQFVQAHDRPLHLAAGLYLLYLGLRTAAARPAAPVDRPAHHRAYAGAVLLTLTNPPTIAIFAAIMASLAPAGGFGPGQAAATVGGVVTGSILWWSGLVAAVAGLRHAMGATARLWIQRLAGATLAAFGLAELRRAI